MVAEGLTLYETNTGCAAEPGSRLWELFRADGFRVALWNSREEKDLGMAVLGLDEGEAYAEAPGTWFRRYGVVRAGRLPFGTDFPVSGA